MVFFKRLWNAALLALGVLILFSSPAKGAPWPDSPVDGARLERVGFAGLFKVGQWTPLAVRVETNRPCHLQLIIEAPDPDGNRVLWPSEVLTADAGTQFLTTLVRTGRLETSFVLQVEARDGEQTWQIPVVAGDTEQTRLKQQALPQAVFLVGTLGDPGGFLNSASATADSFPLRAAALPDPAPESGTTSSASEPRAGEASALDQAAGLESLDALVIAGQYGFPSAQAEAIRQWVEQGGHLVVSVGGELEAYQSSALAGWLSGGENTAGGAPFRVTEPTQHRDLSALESFAEKPERITISLGQPLPGARIELTGEGETLVSVLSGPLVVRAPYGLGTLTMIGVDLNRPPLSDWAALPSVLRKLLEGRKPRTVNRAQTQTSQLAYSGISEFATQIHAVLSDFPGIHRPSAWLVIGLMFLYLLVIGPVDYFFVHRVLKRPGLTWITFPLLVMLAAVSSVWTARAGNGETLLSNQVDVLDLDVASGTLHSRSWVTIYSPETRRYQVTWEPNPAWADRSQHAPAPPVRLSWFGVPESTFGGTYREGGLQPSRPFYQFATQAKAIDNLPIPLWGTKTLTAEWVAERPELVESRLESPGGGQLRGTFSHRFPVPLTDWFLAYDKRVFRPRTNPATGQAEPLPANFAWPPNDPSWRRINQRELSGYLTGTVARRVQTKDVSKEDVRLEQAPYDPLAAGNPDPLGDILRVLTFHRRVGGKGYTGLENHSLREMDLSGRLDLNRAVLFGRLELPAGHLALKDHTPQEHLHAVFVRIVLPVQQLNSLPTGPLKLKD